MPTLADFSATRLHGDFESLSQYLGNTVLIVNTASHCGFTPQYEGLEQLYERFQGRGFVVLGFPCNQFGAQEPGDSGEIASFCKLNYGVTFPMFEKIDVNGSAAHPLYQWLKRAAPGALGTEAIKWNFTKFLLNARGEVVRRYAPTTTPEALAGDVEAQLSR